MPVNPLISLMSVLIVMLRVVSTLCRFYNASGDTIRVQIEYSWRGSFYIDTPASTVENGQWTTFLHVKPLATPFGSRGAVVYRTAGDTDVFIGWQNPLNFIIYGPTCWAKLTSKPRVWDQRLLDKMEGLLNDSGGSRKSVDKNGYRVGSSVLTSLARRSTWSWICAG